MWCDLQLLYVRQNYTHVLRIQNFDHLHIINSAQSISVLDTLIFHYVLSCVRIALYCYMNVCMHEHVCVYVCTCVCSCM